MKTTSRCSECGKPAGYASVHEYGQEFCRPCAEKLDLIYDAPTLVNRGGGRWCANESYYAQPIQRGIK